MIYTKGTKISSFHVRERSLIMASGGVGKLEGGRTFWGIRMGGTEFFLDRLMGGGGTDFFGPLIILFFTHNFYLFKITV